MKNKNTITAKHNKKKRKRNTTMLALNIKSVTKIYVIQLVAFKGKLKAIITLVH